MNVLLFGRSAEPWLTQIIDEVQAAADARHKVVEAVPIETVLRSPGEWESVERLYVLPFDLPANLSEDLPMATPRLLATLFPHAEILNPAPSHELCWDKLASAQRLLERGVPMPETLITNDPAEASDFVRHHQYAVLKEPRSCGGHGHVVLMAGADGGLAGEVPGRRYAVELQASGIGRTVHHGVLSVPAPFYLQRLVSASGRGGVLRPAQVLRAYIVNGQVAFWTERYRDKIRRPADFIISATFGARYRFVRAVDESLEGLARRAADALGARIGAVDVLRADNDGPFVLEADSDGQHMFIDRSFKALPEYRSTFDLDRMIADALLTPAPDHRAGAQRADADAAPRPRRPRPDRNAPSVPSTRGRVTLTKSPRSRAAGVRAFEPRSPAPRRGASAAPRSPRPRPVDAGYPPRGGATGAARFDRAPPRDAAGAPRRAAPRSFAPRSGGTDAPRYNRPRPTDAGGAARSSGPRSYAPRSSAAGGGRFDRARPTGAVAPRTRRAIIDRVRTLPRAHRVMPGRVALRRAAA
ncbi:MAG: hypothetical protein ABI629_12345 [bacterium]